MALNPTSSFDSPNYPVITRGKLCIKFFKEKDSTTMNRKQRKG